MTQDKNMTARVCLFSRAWHHEHSACPVFDDPPAGALMSAAERQGMEEAFYGGASFFLPGFTGTREEALTRIVNGQLAPSPLGRGAFIEDRLEKAVKDGASQYLMLAAGYDSFPARQPGWAKGLRVFELDLPDVMADRRARFERAGLACGDNVKSVSADLTGEDWTKALREAGFDPGEKSFVSIPGLCYYLDRVDWQTLLGRLSSLLAEGSEAAFDYPLNEFSGDEQGGRTAALARQAGEAMKALWPADEMERCLAEAGFEAEESLSPDEITRLFFDRHNAAEPQQPIEAARQVGYVLARKKHKSR